MPTTDFPSPGPTDRLPIRRTNGQLGEVSVSNLTAKSYPAFIGTSAQSTGGMAILNTGEHTYLGAATATDDPTNFVPAPFVALNAYDTDVYGVEDDFNYTDNGQISLALPGVYAINLSVLAINSSFHNIAAPDWIVQVDVHSESYDFYLFNSLAGGSADNSSAGVSWSWTGKIESAALDTIGHIYVYVKNNGVPDIYLYWSITITRMDV